MADDLMQGAKATLATDAPSFFTSLGVRRMTGRQGEQNPWGFAVQAKV